MGVLDIGREIIATFKADISDHKSKLKELEGAEKDLAEQELKAQEARNVGLEGWERSLTLVKKALTAVHEVGEFLWDGYKEGIADARLSTAAYGIDIERLKEAAHGLVQEHELLGFAAKANRAAFKNTQEDMVNAERAMYALTEQGREHVEVTEAVSNAINDLKVKGLTDMGIYVDTSKVKFDEAGNVVDNYSNKLELHQRILEALKVKGEEVAEGEDGIGDAMGRTVVSLQDSWAELKKGLGELVTAMQPLLASLAETVVLVGKISALAGVGAGTKVGNAWLGLAGDVVDRLTDNGNTLSGIGHGDLDEFGSGEKAPSYANGTIGDEASDPRSNIGSMILENPRYKKWVEEAKAQAKHDAEAIAAKMRHDREKAIALADKVSKELTDELLATLENEVHQVKSVGIAADDGMLDLYKAAHAEMNSIIDDTLASQQLAAKHDFLESLFGKLDDFEIYKQALRGLGDAAAAGLDAMIRGSESGAAAFKKSLGSMLHGLAMKELAMGAMKEGEAVIDLIEGDPVRAAADALAGLKYLAIGAGLDMAASELGYGATNVPKSGGGGAPSLAQQGGAGNAPGSQQQHERVIVYGDPFADDSPRMRQLRAIQMVQDATGRPGTENH